MELHDLYTSPNIITGNKLRWIRWAGFVVRAEKRNVSRMYRVLVGSPKKENRLEDLHVNERIILECILNKYDSGA
jgi:hypothetical protein